MFSTDFKKDKMMKIYCIVCEKYRKLKTLKCPIF